MLLTPECDTPGCGRMSIHKIVNPLWQPLYGYWLRLCWSCGSSPTKIDRAARAVMRRG